MNRRHILDDTSNYNDNYAYEWDTEVWTIQVKQGGTVLYCKPGELEKMLRNYTEPNQELIIQRRQLDFEKDCPNKEFEGF